MFPFFSVEIEEVYGQVKSPLTSIISVMLLFSQIFEFFSKRSVTFPSS